MAPMTRSRAKDAGQPDAKTALYYRQRASAGLIVSEGTSISPQSQGYLFVPGLYTQTQVERWKPVTAAVHAEGGHIFAQLWHVGRISHCSIHAQGHTPVSSVNIRATGATCYAFQDDGAPGRVVPSQPRALSLSDISRIRQDYVRAAQNALLAGFDGVEIHAANGYLIEQFINAGLNTRQDRYGGTTLKQRTRLALEVVDAVIEGVGGKPVGIRLSPFGRAADMHAFDGEADTWLYLGYKLSKRALAYVHLNNHEVAGGWSIPDDFFAAFRQIYPGTLILAGGYDRTRAEAAIDKGIADLIAFGRPFIANPDLVARMQHNWPLAQRDQATVYGGDARGYTDYSSYQPPGPSI